MNSNLKRRHEACISNLREAGQKHYSLPLGIVAGHLDVSRQTLFDLVQDGRVQKDYVSGARWVVVDSALTYAEARYQRILRKTQKPRP